MREILFRGMTVNGKFVDGNLSVLKNDLHYSGKIDKGCYISNSCGAPFAYQVRPETVGQFTGLTDKNGQKIFEGDIVEHNGTRFTVEFAKSHHGFICVNKKQRTRGGFPNWRDGYWMWRVDKYLQVVGNIHDDDEEEGLKYHLEDYDGVKHKIRACPKCGGAPDRNNCGPELQGVSCFTCGIHSTEGREFGSNKMLISAIGMWNRREFD